MWKCSLSTYTGGDGEVESSGALCKKKDAKHEDRRRRERAVVFCLEKGEHMTEFEIDAIFNTICRPGRVVRILTKSGKEENIPVGVWKRWTIIKAYEHHVLMQSEKGYHESFSNIDIRELIRKGDIRWK